MLKAHESKEGTPTKRFRAGLDDECLLEVLSPAVLESQTSTFSEHAATR